MLCESDVNPMTTYNMMIYRSQTCVYGHTGMCYWAGLESMSDLLTISFHDEKKISYLIECTAFNGVHVHRANTKSERIHNNCRQNQYQSLEENPQISVGLAVLSHRNLKNHKRHIYSCSGQHTSQYWDLQSFSLRISTILQQFMRSKSKMARGIWNSATVDLSGIYGIIFGFWVLLNGSL